MTNAILVWFLDLLIFLDQQHDLKPKAVYNSLNQVLYRKQL